MVIARSTLVGDERAPPPLRQGPERRAHRRGDLLGGDEGRERARGGGADSHRAAFRAPPEEGRERRRVERLVVAQVHAGGAQPAEDRERREERRVDDAAVERRRGVGDLREEERVERGEAREELVAGDGAAGGAAGRVHVPARLRQQSREGERRAVTNLEGVTNEGGEEERKGGNERERRTPPGAPPDPGYPLYVDFTRRARRGEEKKTIPAKDERAALEGLKPVARGRRSNGASRGRSGTPPPRRGRRRAARFVRTFRGTSEKRPSVRAPAPSISLKHKPRRPTDAPRNASGRYGRG